MRFAKWKLFNFSFVGGTVSSAKIDIENRQTGHLKTSTRYSRVHISLGLRVKNFQLQFIKNQLLSTCSHFCHIPVCLFHAKQISRSKCSWILSVNGLFSWFLISLNDWLQYTFLNLIIFKLAWWKLEGIDIAYFIDRTKIFFWFFESRSKFRNFSKISKYWSSNCKK